MDGIAALAGAGACGRTLADGGRAAPGWHASSCQPIPKTASAQLPRSMVTPTDAAHAYSGLRSADPDLAILPQASLRLSD
jgi:hypothetical protein